MLPGPTAFRSSRVTLISPLPTEVVRTGRGATTGFRRGAADQVAVRPLGIAAVLIW